MELLNNYIMKLTNGQMQPNKYKLSLADINTLIYIYYELCKYNKSSFISNTVYNFLLKHTHLTIKPDGIGWAITL